MPLHPFGTEFYQCPACEGSLAPAGAGRLSCVACHHDIAIVDGILDFVAGASGTRLDDIDYDAVYGINAEHSLELHYMLLRATGPFWPTDFGNALEIGCGTGGLSLALFSQIKTNKIVLTDISPKMLGICRERVRRAMPDRVQSFDFATYSGTERCFRDGSFDSCFGTAVVHHIADVPMFLKQVNDLLTPGGFAFFVEPNLAFHRALTATMADIVTDFLRDGSVTASDSTLMMNWTAEVHCEIVNTGDIEVLAEREDKHIFDGARFLDWARDAGFGGAVALPCDPDPDGWNTVETYLQQCGVTPDGFAALARVWPATSRRHFAALASNDQSPSYLFWLRKVTWPTGTLRGGLASQGLGPVRVLPTEFWVSANARQQDGMVEINLGGWCLADVPVASVQIVVGDVRRRLPIWLPRPDVQSAADAQGLYPVLHALCCGFEGVIRCDYGIRGTKTVDASFQIICCDGSVLDAGVMDLTIGAEPNHTYHMAIMP